MESRTELECIIATESTKTPTKIQKQRLGIIVIHYHYARLVSILHSALAISNAPLVFSHGLLSTEHSLSVCPQGRTSPTHTSNTSQRISNFPLEERRNNRIAFCQNHMKRTSICWWQKALQRRGRIWRKRRRRRIIRRRRGSALCNRAATQPWPSYPKPLQQEAHIMIPLVRFRGCIIHWLNILFLIHWQSVLSKRSLIALWSLLCASMDLSFTRWRACSSPTDNPCCPSKAYFHLLRIMCFSFFLFFSS
jgi:hypothetical protein